ncbi:BppU family phage baseplate upper protein, partial [Enterococcus malodoratus]|uniref:BppU family phage baseplate upper protein n=1 Tax=Enterococcus malodoratus TaxID=71451 RepID=UPI0039B0F044
MYKTNDEIVKIQAKETTPIPTGVVFWSHDKGTAKLRFELLNGPVAQNIAEGSTVPIRLEFTSETAEGGKGKHDYLATIEDRVNGIVSVVLADNIMGYVGTVTGSIYIDFPNSTSIDTAGRFTFEIRRSPIDENTPEVEDYFFNGWSEIQKKLDEKIALTDLEIEKLKIKIDSLDKKADGLKATQEAILQSIADNELATKDDLEKAKQESSANVIYQLIGKEEAEILITADFKEKITGSVVENPNIIRFSTNSTFMAPLTGSEPGQVHYDQAMTKDGVTLNVGNTKSDYMSQIQQNWNLVEIVDRTIPELFETLGLTDDSEKIEFIKKSVSSLRNSVDGVGSGLRRNRLTLKLYDSSGLLEAEESVNVTSQIQELVRETTDRTTIQNRISDSGFVSGLIYTEASDGVAVSQASLDYTKLQIKLKVSANLLIKLMMAAYCGENSVSLSEPQTVEGLKNFSDGVQSKGIDVATQDLTKVTLFQSTELSNVKGTMAGIVWPIDKAAIVFGGVGAHARRGGTSEPGTIYFNEAGQYLIELLWFVNSA